MRHAQRLHGPVFGIMGLQNANTPHPVLLPQAEKGRCVKRELLLLPLRERAG